MTGLEKILKQIQDDAQKSADEVLNRARKQADSLLAQAREEGMAESEAMLQTTREKAEELERRGESAAALQRRRTLLKAKQALIQEAIDYSYEFILKLPDKKYFDAMIKMVKKYALPQNGVIHFGKRDLERLPTTFPKALARAVPKGFELTISQEVRDIEGGFILVYGDVEENCSVSALIDGNREAIQDGISSLLFPGGH